MKQRIGHGEPNTLYSGGLDSLLEDFHGFCEVYLYPLVNGVVKTKQLDLHIPSDMEKMEKVVKDIFQVCKDNQVFDPSLMYYKGANPEMADEAECIEIVGVSFEFDKGNVDKLVMKPVCAIMPEPWDGIRVLGTYIGRVGDFSVFVNADFDVSDDIDKPVTHKGLNVVQVSREPNSTEFNIHASYIPCKEIIRSFKHQIDASFFSTKVVTRAELLGVINATDFED